MTDDAICRGDARHTAADRRVPGTGGGDQSPARGSLRPLTPAPCCKCARRLLPTGAQGRAETEGLRHRPLGKIRALSFQPRPFEAPWTAEVALIPSVMHHRATDPLVAGTARPSLGTSDMLALALLLNYRAFGLENTLDGIVTDGATRFRFSP